MKMNMPEDGLQKSTTPEDQVKCIVLITTILNGEYVREGYTAIISRSEFEELAAKKIVMEF